MIVIAIGRNIEPPPIHSGIRPRTVVPVVRRIGRRRRVAASMKTLVLVLYPIVVAAVLFLLALNALRYHRAVDYFATCLVSTLGVVAVAILLYRAVLRRLLTDRDWSRVVRREDRAARIPENGRHTFTEQRFPDNLCPGPHRRCSPAGA